MLNTKLILVEGLPGAGKTTTSSHLQTILQQQGLECRQYLEEDHPHPIDCLDFEIKGLAEKVVPPWEKFVEHAKREQVITIIESRLWQNTALFMYMSDCATDEIFQFNRQVWRTVKPLAPVLVYLDQEDTERALSRLYRLRGEEWMEDAMETTSQYKWFRERGLKDFAGWVRFFEEWRQLAERLYCDWPGQKVKIINPHEDWTNSYHQMSNYLQVEDNA
jgi:hypothetical protein